MANVAFVPFTGAGSPAAQTLYRKKAWDFLRKDLRFTQTCIGESLPKNGGQTISTYRIGVQAANTTPLNTGAGNGDDYAAISASSAMQGEVFTATVDPYGAWWQSTDIMEVQGRSDTMEQWSRQIGYNGGLSLDTVTYTGIIAGATAHHCNLYTSVNFAADAYLTSRELRRLAKKFRANSIPTHDDGFFHMFAHPDCEYDIMTDDQFASVSDFQRRNSEGNENATKGVTGIYGGFKVWTTPLISTTTVNGVTAYQNFACGYGHSMNLKLSGNVMPFQLIINPASNVSTGNELATKGSIGWKAWYAYKWISESATPRGYKVLAAASEAS
jgi:N4-gp56 family major capsid protein